MSGVQVLFGNCHRAVQSNVSHNSVYARVFVDVSCVRLLKYEAAAANGYLALWIITALGSSVFSYWWDVVHDWYRY